MQIIVLHGNDTLKSYDRLLKFVKEAKRRSWKITDFSLEEIENQSLFGEENFYLLYDYKILDKKLLERLKKYSGNLIVYTAGCHPAIHLKMLKPDKIEKFELPQLLWKFLDNMTIAGFHELLKTHPVEYIMAMIAWKFKQNYRTNPTPDVGFLISELAEIDVKAKTGKADLILSLDLFIINNLK